MLKIIPPPFDTDKIPKVLFDKIHRVNELALSDTGNKEIIFHLTELENAYHYVYYAFLVDKILNRKDNGLIVDWGGFCGQVTVLLRSLGYNCENYGLYLPQKMHLFKELDIPTRINENDSKKLPYESNSCLAVISSGVLEHVGEEKNTTDVECLGEIFRIIRPGGYFFCWLLPRKSAAIEVISEARGKGFHEKRYSNGEFKKMIKDMGFNLEYFDTHGDILFLSKYIRDMVNRKNGIWKGICIDYWASKLPVINLFAHHITAVCRKPQFPLPLAGIGQGEHFFSSPPCGERVG